MGADRIQKALADAGLPRPYSVEQIDGQSFVFRQTFPVDRQFTRTFLCPFLSDAKRVRPSHLLRPGYDKRRVEFVDATYVLFCPLAGGTSIVVATSLSPPGLQDALIKFRDLLGMLGIMPKPHVNSPAIPQPKRGPRVALRA